MDSSFFSFFLVLTIVIQLLFSLPSSSAFTLLHSMRRRNSGIASRLLNDHALNFRPSSSHETDSNSDSSVSVKQISQHEHGKATKKDTKAPSPIANNDSSSTPSDLALGLSQLGPFLRIAVPFFKEDRTARNSLLAVSALTLLNSGISVAFSYISRDFYNALNARDQGLFYEKITMFFGALILAVPVSVYYRYVREKLSLYWREQLTARALQQYYSNRTYYVLETLREIDNPDQRISEDIRHFTRTSLDFFITIFTSMIDLLSFSAILYQIYPGLFVAVVVYAGVGSVVTTKLGQSLVSLNYERLQREANFRFSLFRTRENAEAIAFYDGDARLEQEGIWKYFQEALESQLGIIKVQRNLEFFTTSYRYVVQILPSLIVAPLYFANKVELGAISQSYGAFNHILSDFSIIINQFEALSAFAAGLTRLSTFFDRINSEEGWGKMIVNNPEGNSTLLDVDSSFEAQAKPLITLKSEKLNAPDQDGRRALLQCKNLTVLTPDASRVLMGNIQSTSHEDIADAGKTIPRGADLTIYEGDRLLIVGASGAGKSSFVRCVAGLWQVGFGDIFWDSSLTNDSHTLVIPAKPTAPKDVFFLPQKPYNFNGNLREQIMYPSIILPNELMNVTVSVYDRFRVGKDMPGSVEAGPVAMEYSVTEDERFLETLRRVQLPNLASRMGDGDELKGLNVVRDWTKTLSLGEQQRLAFARILYNRPKIVVLDEATSALDLASEVQMYTLLKELGITYLSVGHRPSLLRFHDRKLVLGGEGLQPKFERIRNHISDTVQGAMVNELVDLMSITAEE